MHKINIKMTSVLCDEIERNKHFVTTVTDPGDRSIMNICFVMVPEYKELENEFSYLAKPRGIIGIEGYRTVGGFRASTYNALPVESVNALVNVMKDFESLK